MKKELLSKFLAFISIVMIIVILFSGRLINREKDNSHENISEKKDEDNDFEMDIVAEEEKMNKIKDEEKNEQKKKEEQGTLYNIITDEEWMLIKNLSPEKRKEFENLVMEGYKMVGRYSYKEKLLLGQISKYNQRMTMSEINAIISENNDSNKIVEEIKKVQPVPDYIGGSGVTNVEYWLDDNGNEKILLHGVDSKKNMGIYYVRESDKKYVMLFDGNK